MRLFKKDMNRFGAADVTETQDAVSAISKALQNGAEQQELATKRLADLARSMNDMDANLRQGKRLQGEVERMDAELTTLREELEKKRAWAQEQSAKLANVQKERDKLRGQLETSKSELSARVEREAGLRDAEFQRRKEGEILNKELNQRTVRLEELVLVQKRVQEELTQAKGQASAQKHKIRELQNAAEEFKLRLGEKTKAADASLAALRDLRLDHHAAKEQLVAANSKLQSSQYEQTSQKNAFDETLKRRADEILALKSQIEQLTTQLRIKDTMGTHFDDETAGLRRALETERERNRVNEQRLQNQAETEGRQARALARAKEEFDTLNAKFVDAMKDLDAFRQVNNVQSKQLENYAQLNKTPMPKRDYAPMRNEDPKMLKVVK